MANMSAPGAAPQAFCFCGVLPGGQWPHARGCPYTRFSIRADDGRTPTILVTRQQFLAANPDVPDLAAALDALAPGQVVAVGGGAAPLLTVRRLR
jgi:hypothetical protein